MLADRGHQMAGSLSGGQQQMLALGRAMVMEPRLLIVDEMTLGLHHSMQPPLFDAVIRIASEGTAVLIVDESTGFALEVAQHCYLIGAGHVIDEGPAEKFRGSELLVAGYTDAEQ
jgi:branched-chain amino acid transport system ATP-binding protein